MSKKLEAGGSPQEFTHSASKPITLKDALIQFKVDESVWEVEHHVLNNYQMGSKGPDGEICVTDLYQIKVWLVRRSPAILTIERLLRGVERQSPTVARIVRTKPPGKHLLEVSIFDLHYGLRCFEGASDGDYNPQIAEKLFMTAIEELLSMSEAYDVSEILFPIGNDFLHSEPTSATTKGILQMTDEPQWVFEHGFNLLVAGINRLKERAKVHVVCINGNHDVNSFIHMGLLVEAWFHNDNNVRVDAGSGTRHYVRYGCNFVAFDHGNECKVKQLPGIILNEALKSGYKDLTTFVWHLGDQHRVGTVVFEEQGVGIEYLPSLVVAERWHKTKGFNNQTRSAMAFLWHKTRGQVARFQFNVS